MIQRLVQDFIFIEQNRSNFTFSDSTKIQLNSSTQRIELKPISIEARTGRNVYSTEANLYVKTQTFRPTTVQKWFGFSAVPRPTLQPSQTSVSYRLNDGTDDYYYDGADWVVAGSSDWNTEQVVSSNIATFPASSKQIAIVVNLKTDNKYATPYIECLNLGFEARVDYVRTLIDSFAYEMDAATRYTLRWTTKGNGTSSITLPAFDPSYNIVSLDAIYNLTDDPTETANLYSSYNTGTRVVTLTSSQDTDDALILYFTAKPSINIEMVSQDYYLPKTVPSITVTRIDLEGAQVLGEQSVRNISNGTAQVRYNPYRLKATLSILVEAEALDTKLHLMESVISYFRNTPLLHWRHLDKQVSMRLVSEGSYNPTSNTKEGYESTFTCMLENVYLWLDPEQTKYLVLSVNSTLDRR